MKYRPEVDGLRAIAVIPVIFFHAGFTLFSGGYVGVDIFFVISGYLITTIIYKEIVEGSFSLINFYERRARRILPALFVVMLFCLPFSWLLFTPTEMKDFGESLIAVSIFSSNVLFWLESGYFDTVSEFKPLLHTWSLAVEEQYYIFFPVFLMIAYKYCKQLIVPTLCITFLISLYLANYSAYNITTSAGFYLLPTRLFEILLGAAIVFLPSHVKLNTSDLQNNLLSLTGLILILISIFTFDNKTPFPSLYTLVPILGSALILAFSKSTSITTKILTNKVFVGIGLVSYSAYLWHQPLIAFTKYKSLEEISDFFKIIIILTTFTLAYFSWRFIENPFRRKGYFSTRKVFVLSIVGISFFIGLGAIIKVNNGFEMRQGAVKYKVGNYNPDNYELQKESYSILQNKINDPNYTLVDSASDEALWFDIADSKPKLLLVGNSHSKDLYNVLNFSNFANENFDFARFGSQIRNLDNRFFTSKNYRSSDIVVFISRLSLEDINALENLIQRCIEDNKKVAIVKQLILSPNYGNRNLADFIIQKELANGIEDFAKLRDDINLKYYENYIVKKDQEQQTYINNMIDNLRKNRFEDLIILDRMSYIVSEDTSTYFAIDENLSKFTYDDSHHTIEGAEFYGGRVDEINWLQPLAN
ncbi:acyltransferase family protein [Aliiglaciecola lipolytica]|uniref:acyltransferase family protein n=1 Tax=Aliiglaciecola lipolytica TaxID=477689 RepID=UPI001C08B6B1|nr:acyltransferase family protein [Aliiglaciecola lipolytica]MBU2880298.1 acyltransferase [Aliiglaciecola lipolytica]